MRMNRPAGHGSAPAARGRQHPTGATARRAPRDPDGAGGFGGRVPPLLRDPWAWLSVLAVLPLIGHSLGAPLGEPVADDFDFLHHVWFTSHPTLLDGGGSQAFWRPVAHQLYYLALGRWILSHPGWIATLHVALLAGASLLLYRAFRPAASGPVAASVATFPLLSESSRMWISWPSHFVDVGLWVFTALALHEARERRLWTALASLLAALLCKEVAVVAVVLLPWLPGIRPRGRLERGRWVLATAVLGALWAAAYLAVRSQAHLRLPHKLEQAATAGEGSPLARLAWATANSVRALFSMPVTPVSQEAGIWVASALVAAVAIVVAFRSRTARRRLRTSVPFVAWGLAWFAAASATLTTIYPIWAPNRSGYGSLGFGVLFAGVLAAIHPLLLASLIAVRVVAFALSPGAPPLVAGAAPERGAFLDFELLVRLQRLMRDTRLALKSEYATMPPYARVGWHYMPRRSIYAFGGDRALQVWYGDTTLRMVPFPEILRHREAPLLTMVEFQPARARQVALVEPSAVRRWLDGRDALAGREPTRALRELAAADSLVRDPGAEVFRGMVAGTRAFCLFELGRVSEAEREAQRSGALWPQSTDRLSVLAAIRAGEGRLTEAAVLCDSVLGYRPGDAVATALLARIRGSNPPGLPPRPGGPP